MAVPSRQRQREIIRDAARSQGIRPRILWGLYGAETDFGRLAGATSSAGAQGPFQFMPGTARGLGIDPHDFEEAAYGAAKYLAQYKGRGRRGMLAAYNAGPAGNPNNPETAAYVPKVLELAKTWRPPGGGGGGGGRGGGDALLAAAGDGSRAMPAGSDGLVSLLAALGEQKPQIQSSGLTAPSFAAGPSLAGQVPVSGGGPEPKTSDVDELLALAQTQAGDLPGGGRAVTPDGRPGSLVPTPVGRDQQGPAAAVSWAQSKVGFREHGENQGGLASRLNRRFGFGAGGAQPWCAMFTSVAVTRGGAPKEARTASVDEVRRKAQAGVGYRGFVNPRRAEQGDLILWGNDHIGIVTGRSGGRIRFIAGNHSDGVREDSVPIGDGDIVRPKYGARR
jgi:hypothetical protein